MSSGGYGQMVTTCEYGDESSGCKEYGPFLDYLSDWYFEKDRKLGCNDNQEAVVCLYVGSSLGAWAVQCAVAFRKSVGRFN